MANLFCLVIYLLMKIIENHEFFDIIPHFYVIVMFVCLFVFYFVCLCFILLLLLFVCFLFVCLLLLCFFVFFCVCFFFFFFFLGGCFVVFQHLYNWQATINIYMENKLDKRIMECYLKHLFMILFYLF